MSSKIITISTSTCVQKAVTVVDRLVIMVILALQYVWCIKKVWQPTYILYRWCICMVWWGIRIVWLLQGSRKKRPKYKIQRLGIELRTSAVLKPRHNQLDHLCKCWSHKTPSLDLHWLIRQNTFSKFAFNIHFIHHHFTFNYSITIKLQLTII